MCKEIRHIFIDNQYKWCKKCKGLNAVFLHPVLHLLYANPANIITAHTLMQIAFTNVPPTPNIVPKFWNIGKKVCVIL